MNEDGGTKTNAMGLNEPCGSARLSALEAECARQRAAIGCIDDILFVLDSEGRHVGVYGSWVARNGMTPEDFLGKTAATVLGPKAAAPHEAAYGRALCGETLSYEWHMPTPEGPRCFATKLTPIFDTTGAICLVAGIGRDISAQRAAEQRAEESADRYRQLIEVMADGVVLFRADGTVESANAAAEQLLGPGAEALTTDRTRRKTYLALRPDGTPLPDTEQPVQVALRTGEPQTGIVLGVNRPDGETGWLRLNIAMLGKDRHSGGGIVSCSDMTQLEQAKRELEGSLGRLQRAQERMVHQERMAAVGQLSAGIAHDFNNILTAIMGNAELLTLDGPCSEETRELLDGILVPGRRAAMLVRQMLDFSRQSIFRPEPRDLVLLAGELWELTRELIPEQVVSTYRTSDHSLFVKVDRSQLLRVFANLASNARDAMPEGGRLDLTVERKAHGEIVRCSGCGQLVPFGDWAAIRVADTGSGIAPEVMPRVFEPFFTTKDVGQGTGLGLSQVLGIIGQHGGHIVVDSTAGRGTAITLYLPLVASSFDRGHQRRATTRAPVLGREEGVLLVEDDPAARRVCFAMLERLNYRTFVASSGAEALALYQEHVEEIALLLTDMMLPDMRGQSLLERLRSAGRPLGAVVMSGCWHQRDSSKSDDYVWLDKPLGLEELSEGLRRALDGPCAHLGRPGEN